MKDASKTVAEATRGIVHVLISTGIIVVGVLIAILVPRLLSPSSPTVEATYLYGTIGALVIAFGVSWMVKRAWGIDPSGEQDRLIKQMASDIAALKDEVQQSNEREAKMLLLLERMQDQQHDLTEDNDGNYVPRTYSN